MSLLNQVLQDLEKRNAEDTTTQNYTSNIKAVNSAQKKSYYLPFALICLSGIIVIFLFNFQNTVSSDIHTVQKQKKTVVSKKLNVAIQPQKNTVNNHHSQKKPVAETVIPKTQTTKKIRVKTNQVPDDKQAIKPANIAKQKPVKNNKKQHTVKKLSNKQKAEQLFKQAEKLQPNSDKQNRLELALNHYPQHINARLLLANTLLYQGLTDKTAAVLDQGLKLFPQNLKFINLRSQLLLQKKQAQAALTIMQKIDADYVQDETYLSLLAAAYQQNNDSFNSLRIYQKLLQINPQKAEYWLGFAIALEKQGHPQQALNAYQQTFNKNTLKPAIISYIKQRISLLK